MRRLRDDVTAIWMAGLDAVRAEPLVARETCWDNDWLQLGNSGWSRHDFDRIVVVGAGKAATAMATGLRCSLGEWLPVSGWINVPEGTERDIDDIHVHVARPAGCNEPTEAAVEGTRSIMRIMQSAGPRDLCIALISGGGSALLALPTPPIRLEEKLQVIRLLSSSGASIVELNTVRKHLSDVKGGGLLAACRANQLVTLVLSDVLGDPLDLIASGPTVDDPSASDEARQILQRFDPDKNLPASIDAVLQRPPNRPPTTARSIVEVLGNNAVAVDAAGVHAESLGYNHIMNSARRCEGDVEGLADQMTGMVQMMLGEKVHDCLITGGEPTVRLAPTPIRGLGGRNQQLVLAMYARLLKRLGSDFDWSRLSILSGGTDGEDGPTDAAGAILDGEVHRRAKELQLVPEDFLTRNDAYTFFARCGGLLLTGATGTNVCDVRVICIR